MRRENPERKRRYEEEEGEDRDLVRFVREGLSQGVAEQRTRLAGIEDRIVRQLGRRARPATVPARPLSLPRLKPAWVLAAVLVIFGAGFLAGTWIPSPLQDGIQGVEFALYAPEAKQVSLAISYPVQGHTEWEAIPLKERNGLWHIRLSLPPGTYEYGFKIDNQWWAQDPAADYFVLGAGNTVNAVREISTGDQT